MTPFEARILNGLLFGLLVILNIATTLYIGRRTWHQFFAWFRNRWFSAAQRRRYQLSKEYQSQTSKAAAVTSFGVIYRLVNHLDIVLQSTLKSYTNRSLQVFGYFSLGSMFVLYVLLYFTTGNLLFPVPISLLALPVPYVFLRLRQHSLGVKNSYQIASVVSLLLAKIRMNQGKMLSALEQTTDDLKDSPVQVILARLTGRLQRYRSPEDAMEAIQQFSASLGTTWGLQLSSIIYVGVVKQYDMTIPLEDLDQDITDIQKAMSNQKADRAETVFSLWVAPIYLVLMLIYMQSSVTHLTLSLQFSKEGMKSFLPVFVLSLVSIIYSRYLSVPKQDI